MPARRHLMIPRWRRILWSLVPLVVLVFVGELAARVWLYQWAPRSVYSRYAVPSEFPSASKYAPHHYLCYVLQPGYGAGGTTHNRLGLRGREVVVPKPQGTFRILVLGGSTTYGEFIDRDEETFPAQLERIVRQHQGYSHVEVINAGAPGYTSWESLGNLAYRLLDLEPDLVIPYEGVNDVHARLVHPSAYRSDNSGRRTLWTEPIEVRILAHSVLLRIVGSQVGLWRLPGVDSFVQASTSDPGTHGPSQSIGGDPMRVLDANPPTFTARNLRSIAALARGHGAKVVFATWAYSPNKGDYAATPHYQRGFAEHNGVVRQVAQELDAPCFEFASVMSTAPELWRDGRHVNARGAQQQGQLFAEFLLNHALIPREETSTLPGVKRGTPPLAD